MSRRQTPTPTFSSPANRLRTQKSASALKPPSTPRARTISTPKSPVRRPISPPELPKTPTLSIREQIALRREEAKKASSVKSREFDATSIPIHAIPEKDDAAIELGRWTIRESVERARTTGTLNLSSRSITSLPKYLFQCHLDITPAPLLRAPPEVEEPEPPRKRDKPSPSWYETQDLLVLKAWNNAIVEIQPEIHLFGSLKTVDLHQNQLTSLPEGFCDLINLVHLDLSSNLLTSLPIGLPTLPLLTTLNISHNHLPSLSLKDLTPMSPTAPTSFFAPAIERASKPLPSLQTLLASHNQFTGDSISADALPESVTKIDLSENRLGYASALMTAFASLKKLRELKLQKCGLSDSSFAERPESPFPHLDILDLEENLDIKEATLTAFLGNRDFTLDLVDDITPGQIKVTFGKKAPVKEQWEIEAERRVRPRRSFVHPLAAEPRSLPEEKRSPPRKDQHIGSPERRTREKVQAPIVHKEAWEIEAEQGLLTEGGRRLARARAAVAAAEAEAQAASSTTASSASTQTSLSLASYYSSTQATLTLPPSQPRLHTRTHSLASPNKGHLDSDISLPLQTVPLSVIESQSFSKFLRILILSNRRKDSSFLLPMAPGLITSNATACLPALEELHLLGCGLGDTSPVYMSTTTSSSPAITTKEPTLPLIATLFPTLSVLDISDNLLTNLTGAEKLLIPSTDRKGLRVLRARGNKLAQLDSLVDVARRFQNEGQIDGWRTEELDLRNNELAKLPPYLGLLPLDVLLVEGNLFRVPARRVWEREGTQGLLKWLKERVE